MTSLGVKRIRPSQSVGEWSEKRIQKWISDKAPYRNNRCLRKIAGCAHCCPLLVCYSNSGVRESWEGNRSVSRGGGSRRRKGERRSWSAGAKRRTSAEGQRRRKDGMIGNRWCEMRSLASSDSSITVFSWLVQILELLVCHILSCKKC